MKATFLPLVLGALAILPASAASIVGSWHGKGAGESKSELVISFLSNGTYIIAEDGDRNLDPTGKDGIERGTYKWNASKKTLTCKTTVDTNGEWGVSEASGEAIPVKLSGNTLTIDGVKFKKVTSSSTKKLQGSWYMKEGRGYALVTFLSNGSFFLSQDGKAEEGGKSGMERGTYTWNSKSKAFNATVKVDTNGTWGLSDRAKRTVTVSGNKLTLKVSGEGSYSLTRLK